MAKKKYPGGATGGGGGYGKPPAEHQFKPGRSGCPGGRGGKKALSPISDYDRQVLAVFGRKVPTADGKEVSLVQRALEQDALAAAQGDDKANNRIRWEFARASALEAQYNADIYGECLEFHIQVSEGFEWTEREGLPAPDFVPHPKHVHITPDAVTITGPCTREERAEWEYIKQEMRSYSTAVASLRAKLKKDPTNDALRKALRLARATLERFRRSIPPGWDWKEQIYTRDSSEEELEAFEARLLEKAKRRGIA